MGFSEVAGLYMSSGLLPFPVKGKRPPVDGATGRSGSVTLQQVEAWSRDPEWRDQNVALRPSGWVGIDVDNYGQKRGAEQLAELEAKLGPLPYTPASTARGIESGSRQMFFALPANVELKGKAAPDIEVIQAHHRYSVVWPSIHPDTGAPYLWFDAEDRVIAGVPSLDDFEMLPNAWLDYLIAPDIEVIRNVDTERSAEGMTDGEHAKLAIIRSALRSLPKVWAEGAGWHDTVFNHACWLARIANTSAYVTTEDDALAILLECTPTYPNWGQDQIMIQWESARQSNVGQYAEAPVSIFPAIPDSRPLLAGLPRFTNDGAMFNELIAEVPMDGRGIECRVRLASQLLASGMTEPQAVAVIWASAAAMELHEQANGLSTVWREVREANLASASSLNIAVELADILPAALPSLGEYEDAPAPRTHHALGDVLTAAERAYLQGEGGNWWGTRYLTWARSRVPVFNEPYHRSMIWTILSLYWANVAVIPYKQGHVQTNIFSITVGPTTTGKSEAFNLGRAVIRECFPGASPNIGGTTTVNGLIEKLVERDGVPSWFNTDEAHGLFKKLAMNGGNNIHAGLRELLTDLYGGIVPTVQFATKKEISGKEATTHFVMQLFGTYEGMMNVLTSDDWTSGFLPRFVWEIADVVKVDDSVYNENDEDEGENDDDNGGLGGMPRQWAAEFSHTRQYLASQQAFPHKAHLEPDAKIRLEAFKRQVGYYADSHPDREMVKPTTIRMSTTVRKIATLVALTEGRSIVDLRHVLIAIQQAEHWLSNLERAVEGTMSSGFAKQVDDLEKYVANGPNRTRAMQSLYQHSRLPKGETDRLVAQLRAEGRVQTWSNHAKGLDMIRIPEEG